MDAQLMPEPEGSGVVDRALRVDLAGLADLARVVRADVDATLRPESGKVRSELAAGVCFGVHSASGYVYGAKQRYQESLAQATETLTSYLRATEILAATAEKVAGEYARADGLSAARVSDVERVLAEAVAAARSVRGGGTGRVIPL